MRRLAAGAPLLTAFAPRMFVSRGAARFKTDGPAPRCQVVPRATGSLVGKGDLPGKNPGPVSDIGENDSCDKHEECERHVLTPSYCPRTIPNLFHFRMMSSPGAHGLVTARRTINGIRLAAGYLRASGLSLVPDGGPSGSFCRCVNWHPADAS